MSDHHLTTDDMAVFTQLRMTAFGQAVIDIANDSDYDDWTFSAKIHHALDIELAARAERRVHKLLKASHTPNPAACVEDIRYLPDRTLTRDIVDRLASCGWIDNATNVIILGKTSVGRSYLAQALVNAACRKDYTVAYWRLDDLGNRLAVYHPSDPGGLRFLDSLLACDVLVLDDFLTTPITMDTTSKILNILASREDPCQQGRQRSHDRHVPIRPSRLVQITPRRCDRRIDSQPAPIGERDRSTRWAEYEEED